jgi:pimeloyl-ACP methyl ester carboxylesterase
MSESPQDEKKGLRKPVWKSCGAVLGLTGILLAILALWSRSRNQKLAERSDDVTQQAVQRLNAAALGINAESIFLEVGGKRFHAIVAGPQDAPLAVLLHGFPEHWYSWRSQIPALAEAGFRVVAYDQRGYNRSDKPRGVSAYTSDELTADIMRIIRALGYETAVIVGHDWGGAIAWSFAMHYPEATERLIVMNAPHPKAMQRELQAGWEQRSMSWYMLFFQIPIIPEAILTFSPPMTAQFFFEKSALCPGAFTSAELDTMAVALAQPDSMTAMINWYRAMLRHPSSRPSQNINTPTLLIWGEGDMALSKGLTYDLDEWVSELEVCYIPECGHWVQNEAPGEVNRMMLEFLAR